MPLQTRRPNLPSLSLLPISYEARRRSASPGGLHTPIRTPTPTSRSPYTPLPDDLPLVMTPDTPVFSGTSLGLFPPPPLPQSASSSSSSTVFSDDEDDTLEAILAHPPRNVRATFPPGSLPPPRALDEMTAQLVSRSGSTRREQARTRSGAWPHSWTDTRARLFFLARRASMAATGGLGRSRAGDSAGAHQRDHERAGRLDRAPSTTSALAMRYAPSCQGYVETDMTEAKRLSATLQSASVSSRPLAQGLPTPPDGHVSSSLALSLMASGVSSVTIPSSGLSSPMSFTFACRRQPQSRASLLQRGKSFTPTDIDGLLAATTAPTTPVTRPALPLVRCTSSPVSSTLSASFSSSSSSGFVSSAPSEEDDTNDEDVSEIDLGCASPVSPLSLPSSPSRSPSPLPSTSASLAAVAPTITLTTDSPPSSSSAAKSSLPSHRPVPSSTTLFTLTHAPSSPPPPSLGDISRLNLSPPSKQGIIDRPSVSPPPLVRSSSHLANLLTVSPAPGSVTMTAATGTCASSTGDAVTLVSKRQRALTVIVPRAGKLQQPHLKSPFLHKATRLSE